MFLARKARPIRVRKGRLTGLQKALLEQRDKHLAQFMQINGQATFAAIATVFVVYFGTGDITKEAHQEWYFQAVVGFTVAGVLMLFVAAALLSAFHTTRIRDIQKRLLNNELPDTNESEQLTSEHLEIVPDSMIPNFLVAIGLMCLVVAALGVFVAELADKWSYPFPY